MYKLSDCKVKPNAGSVYNSRNLFSVLCTLFGTKNPISRYWVYNRNLTKSTGGLNADNHVI